MHSAALVVALALFAADVDSDFTAALNTAKANIRTPEGTKYDHAIATAFGAKHSESMAHCTAGVSGENLASFDVVARVGANGKLEVVWVRPETNVARCLKRKMKDDLYPPPPKPGYWVNVHVSINP